MQYVTLLTAIDTSTWGGKLGIGFLLFFIAVAVLALLGRSGDGKKMNQTASSGGGSKKKSKPADDGDDE